MKFFAVVPTLLAVCAAEAQLPIAAQYLGAAGLYQGYSGLTAGAYASPYAAYGPAAVDAKFAYGAPITALNAGPLTAAAPLAVAAPDCRCPSPNCHLCCCLHQCPCCCSCPCCGCCPYCWPCQLSVPGSG